MIPAELLQVIDTNDEEDFNLGIMNVAFDDAGFRFDLSMKTIYEEDETSYDATWRVDVVGHRENRVSFNYASDIRIEQEHPLLWKYTDIQGNLYFAGSCSDPTKLFYRMYHVHQKLFGSYIPFGKFLNVDSFERLFEMKSGLLAKGPKPLLTHYGQCLGEAGMDWSIISNSHQPEKTDLKILLLDHTDNYFIGEDFIFTLL